MPNARFALRVPLAGLVLSFGAVAGNLQFDAVKAPETDAEMRRIGASPRVVVDGQAYPIGFHTLLRSGDTVGGGTFGLLTDRTGKPLADKQGSPRISNANDFSSLIPVGDKLFMVSHFEDLPGAMYLSELAQDRATGILAVLATRPIDLSGVGGGWNHCAGSATPWGTHLGSEEYEPDARRVDPDTGRGDAYFDAMGAYDARLNPYAYGWPVEVRILDESGATQVVKHYAMGRRSLELAYTMPDRRTLYLTDDGTNVGLYLFVADRAEDLSAGTLYAARWVQRDQPLPPPSPPRPDGGLEPGLPSGASGRDGGAAALQWVNLGHATAAEIGDRIEQRIAFRDIFTAVDPENGACPAGFSHVNAGHGAPFHECLKLREGMDKAASRLESRRYAALRGATTEWRKMEGIAFDPDGRRLFLAMSEVSRGMEDFRRQGKQDPTFDEGGPNRIRLPYNLCGVVYALNLAGGDVSDTGGKPIPSRFVATDMVGEVAGRMTQTWDVASPLPAYPADGPFTGNACHLEGIANPDNLTFIPGYHTLIIGEDTSGGHRNDALWAYRTDTGSLTRIQTAPYGAEATSPYFYPNIGGFAYLMSVIQHPYGESERDKLVAGSGDERAYTGYIGPLPTLPR